MIKENDKYPDDVELVHLAMVWFVDGDLKERPIVSQFSGAYGKSKPRATIEQAIADFDVLESRRANRPRFHQFHTAVVSFPKGTVVPLTCQLRLYFYIDEEVDELLAVPA